VIKIKNQTRVKVIPVGLFLYENIEIEPNVDCIIFKKIACCIIFISIFINHIMIRPFGWMLYYMVCPNTNDPNALSV